VDGISDQSLPAWDGGFAQSYFGRLFSATWVSAGHVRLARYVAQWDLMGEPSAGADPHGDYRERLEAWLADVRGLGLVPELALTSYNGIYPHDTHEYETSLRPILNRARAIGSPVSYVEAWNEPNNQGNETAEKAAELTNSASRLCEEDRGCRVVAGNLEDSPNVAAYEREYERALDPLPTIWGIHPYRSVAQESEAPILEFMENLPNGGAGDQIWFTEVAARVCTDYGGQLREIGEAGQAQQARWLVDTLMPDERPEHVFYYVFLLGDHKQPSCAEEPEDDALYEPSGEAGAPDVPRAAASYIWGGEPDALTGGCSEPLAFERPVGGRAQAIAWSPPGGSSELSLTVLPDGCRALTHSLSATFIP
jgi:hypothetical protein